MGLSESSLQATFNHLDKSHSGTVSMEDLLSEGDPNTPIPYMCSLLALYHFDTTKKGTLNYVEFKRMYHFIQKILKQSTKKHSLNRGKNVMTQFSKKLANKEEKSETLSDYSGYSSDPESHLHHNHGHQSHRMSRSKGGSLRVITSFDSMTPPSAESESPVNTANAAEHYAAHPEHHHGHDTHSTYSAHTSALSEPSPGSPTPELSAADTLVYPSTGTTKSSWITIKTNGSSTTTSSRGSTYVCQSPHIPHYESSSISPELQENVQQWFQKLMKWKNFDNKVERLKFLEWLYKACDMDKSGKIDMHKLECFLITTEKDGIDLTALLFDQKNVPAHELKNRDMSFHEFIELIMAQYDIGKHGYLSKEEFFTLGNLVLSCYQSFERMSHYSNMTVGEWKLRFTLGEGAYGIVKFATHTLHMNQYCAVKIIKQGNVSDMSKLDCEIQCLQMLDHPNIVRLFDVITDEENIYLLMELCGGGNLFQNLEEKQFEEPLARFYFSQLVSGLAYCQSNGVCHRDLRLENLLLDNMGNLKISDFGAARIFSKGWDLFSTQLVGSIYHLSPEQIEGKVYSGSKVDVWSCGVILFSFLTAELPFCSEDTREIFAQIREADYEFPENITLSEEVKDLIKRMLTVDPEKRITVEEILEHPWLKGAQSKPQLINHHMEFVTKVSRERFCTLYSNVLSEFDTFSLCLPSEGDNQLIKCINAARYLKFKSVITGNEESGVISVDSRLVGGPSNHYQKILAKAKKACNKKLKELNTKQQLQSER